MFIHNAIVFMRSFALFYLKRKKRTIIFQKLDLETILVIYENTYIQQ